MKRVKLSPRVRAVLSTRNAWVCLIVIRRFTYLVIIGLGVLVVDAGLQIPLNMVATFAYLLILESAVIALLYESATKTEVEVVDVVNMQLREIFVAVVIAFAARDIGLK